MGVRAVGRVLAGDLPGGIVVIPDCAGGMGVRYLRQLVIGVILVGDGALNGGTILLSIGFLGQPTILIVV